MEKEFTGADNFGDPIRAFRGNDGRVLITLCNPPVARCPPNWTDDDEEEVPDVMIIGMSAETAKRFAAWIQEPHGDELSAVRLADATGALSLLLAAALLFWCLV